MGLSKIVSIASICLTDISWLAGNRDCTLSASLISARGDPGNSEGSGDIDGCGVGSKGGNSGVTEVRDARVGAALFLFRGDALLDGDCGSGAGVCSGSKISDGSMLSAMTALRVLPEVLGVFGIEAATFRLDCICLLGLLWGAGVNSSSLSSFTFWVLSMTSSSSEESTIFRRAAALLDGLVGDSMVLVLMWWGLFTFG
jgi:hypothetical protein